MKQKQIKIKDDKNPSGFRTATIGDPPSSKPGKLRYQLIFKLPKGDANLTGIALVGDFKSIKKATKRGLAIAKASKGLMQFEGCSS